MKLTKLKMLEIMARVPLFKSLTPQCRERVLQSQCTIEAKMAGNTFIKEGSHDPFFYIVLSGQAMVKQSDQHIATLKPGEFIGEVGFFCSEPRTATVIAMADMFVMKFDRKSFQTLPPVIRESIKDKVIAGLTQRIKRQTEEIIRLSKNKDMDEIFTPDSIF